MDLQSILDAVLHSSGVATESAYASSSEDRVLRLVSLANRSVAYLSRYPYQALRETHEFTLSTDTEYTLPNDFKAFVPDTFFTDDRIDPVGFPTSAEEWGYLQATSGGSSITVRARLLGDRLHIYEPDSGEALRFEYITKNPVQTAAGVGKQYFTLDTDTTLLDDDLLILHIVQAYKRLMGFEDWMVDLANFQNYERTLQGQDSGSATLRPGEFADAGPYYNLWRPVPNT